jgi:hypothetical protein
MHLCNEKDLRMLPWVKLFKLVYLYVTAVHVFILGFEKLYDFVKNTFICHIGASAAKPRTGALPQC